MIRSLDLCRRAICEWLVAVSGPSSRLTAPGARHAIYHSSLVPDISAILNCRHPSTIPYTSLNALRCWLVHVYIAITSKFQSSTYVILGQHLSSQLTSAGQVLRQPPEAARRWTTGASARTRTVHLSRDIGCGTQGRRWGGRRCRGDDSCCASRDGSRPDGADGWICQDAIT